MQLKVEVDGKSNVYKFSGKKKISIGRSPTCEIQIIADGVSRKHVDIEDKNGSFFVLDHGSTNGSFIDEKQLEPKKKYDFNTFFPIRLGFNVYVFLLDEA